MRLTITLVCIAICLSMARAENGFIKDKAGGEERQAAATDAFLRQARERGWAGTLIWAFDFPGSPKEHRLMNAGNTWRPAAGLLREFADKISLSQK